VIGTLGDLRVEPAYDYAGELVHALTIKGKTRERRFEKRDQFGPEIAHFSECIRDGSEPDPGGREGMADVRIIQALYKSAKSGKPVKVDPLPPAKRPSLATEIHKPAVREPDLVHATSPSGDEE
jgi:glucose-fructose oxidoreductase